MPFLSSINEGIEMSGFLHALRNVSGLLVVLVVVTATSMPGVMIVSSLSRVLSLLPGWGFVMSLSRDSQGLSGVRLQISLLFLLAVFLTVPVVAVESKVHPLDPNSIIEKMREFHNNVRTGSYAGKFAESYLRTGLKLGLSNSEQRVEFVLKGDGLSIGYDSVLHLLEESGGQAEQVLTYARIVENVKYDGVPSSWKYIPNPNSGLAKVTIIRGGSSSVLSVPFYAAELLGFVDGDSRPLADILASTPDLRSSPLPLGSSEPGCCTLSGEADSGFYTLWVDCASDRPVRRVHIARKATHYEYGETLEKSQYKKVAQSLLAKKGLRSGWTNDPASLLSKDEKDAIPHCTGHEMEVEFSADVNNSDIWNAHVVSRYSYGADLSQSSEMHASLENTGESKEKIEDYLAFVDLLENGMEIKVLSPPEKPGGVYKTIGRFAWQNGTMVPYISSKKSNNAEDSSQQLLEIMKNKPLEKSLAHDAVSGAMLEPIPKPVLEAVRRN